MTDLYTPTLGITYPELHPQKEEFVQKPETQVFKPITDTPSPITEHGSLEEEDEEERLHYQSEENNEVETESQPKRLWSKFVGLFIRSKAPYTEIQSLPDLNPSRKLQGTSELEIALKRCAPVTHLIKAGIRRATQDELLERGIDLSLLRNYRRSTSDLNRLWPTLNELIGAGFTELHLDSNFWSLAQLATAYKLDQRIVAQQLNCSLRDLLRSEKFGFTREQLFKDSGEFHFTSAQLSVLKIYCNWTKENFRNFGCTANDIEQIYGEDAAQYVGKQFLKNLSNKSLF
jgi:hypothetical protein